MAISPGQHVSQYVVERKIGEGGMGAVYLAEQPSIHRKVVLKLLSTGSAGDPDMLRRFQREVDIIAQLEHPHILPVYDFGEVDGDPYIVMRYMAGGSLYDHLRAHSLSRADLLRVLDQVAEALDYAHERGVIHRDLKPGNVLLDEAGNGYLADFGLAKTMEGTRDLTKTGNVLGTPAYMSPEQARGEHLDGRSDVYSFAVMAFEALSGARPFEAKTPLEYIQKHLSEPPRSIRAFARDLPPAVDTPIFQALAKNRDQRPAHVSDFARQLRQSLSAPQDTPAAAYDMGGVTSWGTRLEAGAPAGTGSAASPVPAARRRRWALPAAIVGLGGVAVVVLAILGLSIYFLRGQMREPSVHAYPVGDSPRAAVYADGAVWVANGFDNSVVELTAQGCAESSDPCGKAVATYPVDDLPVGLAQAQGELWIANALHLNLTRMDMSNGTELGRTKLPSVPSSLLATSDAMWMVSDIGGSVTKVSLAGEVQGEYPVGQGSQAMADVDGTLWVANQKDENVVSLDPVSGKIGQTIPLPGGPSSLAYDGVHLWVALADANQVVALDPSKGSKMLSVNVQGRPVALLYDGTLLWAAAQKANDVVGIDPKTGNIQSTIGVTGGPYALTSVSCGQSCADLWVVGEAGDTVSRVRVK